jgi:integral membrane protein
VYFVYLIFTANLAVKVRWPIGKTIGVLLAGTIPLVGIIVEQIQTRDIKQRFNF